jgi:hypothetical protein
MDIEEQKRVVKPLPLWIARSININERASSIIQSSFNNPTEPKSINSTLDIILGLLRKVKRILSHIKYTYI